MNPDRYMIIESEKDPVVSVFLDEATRDHIARHFNNGVPGSKFNVASPEDLLRMIINLYPDAVASAVVNKEGVKIVSVVFPDIIGSCNVVSDEELTKEEKSSIHLTERDDSFVRCAFSHRVFPTRECQLILDDCNHVITVYPGVLAPPVPSSPNIKDPFWDKHVFIVDGYTL